MVRKKTPPWYGDSGGPMMVACQWNKSSPTGPALHCAGGSRPRSWSSLLILFRAIFCGNDAMWPDSRVQLVKNTDRPRPNWEGNRKNHCLITLPESHNLGRHFWASGHIFWSVVVSGQGGISRRVLCRFLAWGLSREIKNSFSKEDLVCSSPLPVLLSSRSSVVMGRSCIQETAWIKWWPKLSIVRATPYILNPDKNLD